MSTRSSSPTTDEDESSNSRLAALEALLSSQLYESATTSTLTSLPPKRPESADPPIDVSFRLFSTQSAPTRITIRSESTPPPISIDPRIRSVSQEPPLIVKQRTKRIESTAVSGQEILQQSTLLPIPHPPSYRHTIRSLHAPLHAPPSSTRAPLPLPSLAYLNSRLPSNLHKLSPLTVPNEESPRTPNEGLLNHGPYTLGKKGDGMKRRLPLELDHGESSKKKKRIKLVVVPVLGVEKVEEHVWEKIELEKKRKEGKRKGEKARRVRRKLKEGKEKDRKRALEGEGDGKVALVGGKGDVVRKVQEKKERRKRKGRLSKERRERIKKRTEKSVKKADDRHVYPR